MVEMTHELNMKILSYMESDYDVMKMHIYPMPVEFDSMNDERKREIFRTLKELPASYHLGFYYFFIVDLSEVFEQVRFTDYITISMIKKWGISVDDLEKQALENLKRKWKSQMMFMPCSNTGINKDGDLNIYVLGIQTRAIPGYSAGLLICDDTLNLVYQVMGSFYAYPVSSTEIYIISVDTVKEKRISAVMMGTILRSIIKNRIDLLTERVFEYDGKMHKVCEVYSADCTNDE